MNSLTAFRARTFPQRGRSRRSAWDSVYRASSWSRSFFFRPAHFSEFGRRRPLDPAPGAHQPQEQQKLRQGDGSQRLDQGQAVATQQEDEGRRESGQHQRPGQDHLFGPFHSSASPRSLL